MSSPAPGSLRPRLPSLQRRKPPRPKGRRCRHCRWRRHRPDASEAPSDAQVIDADGLILLPGFVDLHTHLQGAGARGCRDNLLRFAGGRGRGYTAILAMANTTPVTDTAEAAERILDLGARLWTCRRPAHRCGHPRPRRRATCRARPHAPLSSACQRLLRRRPVRRRRPGHAARAGYIRSFGGVVSQHSQDPALAGPNACCHEGGTPVASDCLGWPAAESVIIARDVQLARHTGSRVHVAHVSTAGVDVIRWAKAQGIAVTAEVTPHHLALTTERLAAYDPVFRSTRRCARSRTSRPFAPHWRTARSTPSRPTTRPCPSRQRNTPSRRRLRDAGPGNGVVRRCFRHGRGRSLWVSDLARVMSSAPPALLAWRPRTPDRAGELANLVLVDPAAAITVDRSSSQSLSRNNPWHGEQFRAAVHTTILRGRVTAAEGAPAAC